MIAFAMAVLFVGLALVSHATPSGPTVTFISNETKQPSAARMINTTGGSITTVVLNATTQDTRWKAYVGNVSGKTAVAYFDCLTGKTVTGKIA